MERYGRVVVLLFCLGLQAVLRSGDTVRSGLVVLNRALLPSLRKREYVLRFNGNSGAVLDTYVMKNASDPSVKAICEAASFSVFEYVIGAAIWKYWARPLGYQEIGPKNSVSAVIFNFLLCVGASACAMGLGIYGTRQTVQSIQEWREAYILKHAPVACNGRWVHESSIVISADVFQKLCGQTPAIRNPRSRLAFERSELEAQQGVAMDALVSFGYAQSLLLNMLPEASRGGFDERRGSLAQLMKAGGVNISGSPITWERFPVLDVRGLAHVRKYPSLSYLIALKAPAKASAALNAAWNKTRAVVVKALDPNNSKRTVLALTVGTFGALRLASAFQGH